LAREAETLVKEREKGGEWLKYWPCREKEGCHTQKYCRAKERERSAREAEIGKRGRNTGWRERE